MKTIQQEIQAGSRKVGDIFKPMFGEKMIKVVSLGKEFTRFYDDADFCCYGCSSEKVQIATFEEM